MPIRKIVARSIGVDVITAEDLADNSITAAEITNGAVTADKLASNSVTTAKITDANVTSGKLASGAAVSNIGYTPVNKAGDTMTGKLTVQSSAYGLKLDGTGRSDIELVHTNAGTDLKRRIIRSIDGEFRVGLENDASSSYANHLNIDGSGRVTTPNQPAFHVRVNSAAYITTSPIPFTNAVFNTGSHYNTSTYRFTAPIAGKYYFVVNVYLQLTNGEDGYPRFRVNGSNRHYSYAYNLGTGGQIDVTLVSNAIFDLSVGDYVDVEFLSATGGAYYGGNGETNFFGYLLG